MSDLILQQSQKLNTLTETILLKDQTIVDLKTKIDNIEKLNSIDVNELSEEELRILGSYV